MPKQVDHQQRRRHIIEALWRLAAREGLSAVSFRRVATEADVSVRRIQYYFGTKASLLADALQVLGERVFERGLSAIETLGPNPPPRELLRAVTIAGLPSDDERRHDSLLFFSFYIAAITDPEYSNESAQQTLGWTFPFATDVIQQGVDQRRTRPGIDPAREALILMSAFHGISLNILAGSQTSADAVAAIDYQLDRIFN